jgi:hypothetical protein
VTVLDRANLDMRVIERGVGWTLACGTGSCAAAAVCTAWGSCDHDVTVDNPGGRLRVQLIDGDGDTLSGTGAVRGERGVARSVTYIPETLIERTFRERIVLVGVQFPGVTADELEASSTSWRSWWTPPAPTSSRASCSAATRPTRRRSSARARSRSCAEICLAVDADTVVFDDNLSPAQQRNLEKILGRTAIDRTAVILDIFAQNARTPEGKAQVELALLQYRLPRLRRRGSLSQQAGGIGTRGPGETQLEVDRRRLVRRMHHIRGELRTRPHPRRAAPGPRPRGATAR